MALFYMRATLRLVAAAKAESRGGGPCCARQCSPSRRPRSTHAQPTHSRGNSRFAAIS
jgi:hypothetical protein